MPYRYNEVNKINPNLRPRHYTADTLDEGPLVIKWTAKTDVMSVASNINGPPLTISEYVAYDTLSPPNPFLAVTQDGNGNVVYDGGFPKYYNAKAPAASATFAQLTGTYKFLYNALNFIADKSKTSKGNRKVLLLGDAKEGQSYAVKGTGGTGFKTSFENLCSVAGYQLTIKDTDDWGGLLDCRYSEYDQYCCVIVIGSTYTGGYNRITNTSVMDLVEYREQGGGVALITDHGPDLTSIEQASTPHDGFFAVCNRIAVHFGAYFTGNFNRSPVNVGHLRTNYGDHPLYNGLTNQENVPAGGSESKVVVREVPTYSPANIPDTVIDEVGVSLVNFMAILTNGEVVKHSYLYVVGTEGMIRLVGWDGKEWDDRGGSNPLPVPFGEWSRRFTEFHFKRTNPELGTLFGYVQIEAFRGNNFWRSTLGTFQVDPDGTYRTEYFIPGMTGLPALGGDSSFRMISFSVTRPFIHHGWLYRDTINSTTPFPGVVGSETNLGYAIEKAREDREGQLFTPMEYINALRKYQETHYGVVNEKMATVIQHYIREITDLKYADDQDTVYHEPVGGETYPTQLPDITAHVVYSHSPTAEEYNSVPEDVNVLLSRPPQMAWTYSIREPVQGWKKPNDTLYTILPGPRWIVNIRDGARLWYSG